MGVKKIVVVALGLVVVVFAVVAILKIPTYATVPGTNVLVNYNTTGNPVLTGNQLIRVSEDGNTVAWSSPEHNVFPGDPFPSSTATVIYKRNLQTGVTSYATPVNTSGSPVSIVENNFAMSRSGRYFAYYVAGTQTVVSSPAVPYNTNNHVYLTDTQLGTTKLVDQSILGSVANNDSTSYTALNVSDDGRFVLFTSYATNLLSSGNPSAASTNFYIKDMKTGLVINPTLSSSGIRANGSMSSMVSSCDGSILAFNSNSTNLTPQDTGAGDVYLVDLRNGYSIMNLSYAANQSVKALSISCNGRYLELATKATNLTADTVSGSINHYFRYDRLTDAYSLIDKSTSGYISTTLAPNANGLGNSTTVSDDGKVIFSSNDHNMVSPAAVNNKEIFLRNPESGITELVPINASGIEQNGAISNLTLEINAKGAAVLYTTTATNLVPGSTTGGPILVLSKVQ